MVNKKFLTEKDIDYLEKRLQETFPTRDEFKVFRSDLFNKLDEILREVLTSREERIIQSHHLSEHGDRITALEKIHPQGKHFSAPTTL